MAMVGTSFLLGPDHYGRTAALGALPRGGSSDPPIALKERKSDRHSCTNLDQ